MDTSIVVAARNDPEGLAATLRALELQTVAREAFEIIVVDDASDDETPTVGERAGATVLRLTESQGSYAARNLGIEQSLGQFIAITDAGCLPAPDWIARGTAPLMKDPMTIVAGRISMTLGPRPSVAAMVDVVNHLDQKNYVFQEGSAVTANILAGRGVFDRGGLFDPRLRSGGDREWVVRARGAGARLIYCQDAVVEHEPRSRASQVLRKSARVAKAGSIARVFGYGSAPASPPLYRTASWMKPWKRQRGRERLAENGARPGLLLWLVVGAGQIALVQAPQAWIAAYWDMRLTFRRRFRSGSCDEPL
jgi:glycosyltransferase involved in cell wall biosynthesis